MPSLYEKVGLALINALAMNPGWSKETIAFGDHDRQAIDAYQHPGKPEGRAAVLFFYGGNWQSGRRQDYRFVADTLFRLGVDVFVADYRLYPEVRFGEIHADARDALALVREHHSGPLVVMGHSAGAQLGSLLALRHPETVQGFVGLAGPYDFFPFTEPGHEDLFAPESAYPESQPVNFVRPDAPPLYLLHGYDDNRVRRGHSKSLMEKQQAAGGEASREVYEKVGHVDIILSFTAWQRAKSPVVRDISAFLKQHALSNPA